MPRMTKLPAVAGAQAAAKKTIDWSTARKDGSPKVKWNESEKRAVTEKVADLLEAGTVHTPLQAVRIAQGMPGVRARPYLRTMGDVSFLPDMLELVQSERASFKRVRELEEQAQRTEAAKAEAVAQAQRIAPPAAAETPQEPAEPETAPTLAAEPESQPTAPIQALATAASFTWRDLRGVIVNELASILVEAGLKAMGSAMLGPQQIDVAESAAGEKRVVFQRAPSPARKPSLLVVGLKSNWRTLIEQQFRSHFDLRFYSTDESKDVLRTRVQSADTVIAMTEHISHAIYESTKHRAVKLIHQAGGVNQLRETISGLVPRATH